MYSAEREVAAMKLLLIHGASPNVQNYWGKYYIYMLWYHFSQNSCLFPHNKYKVELDMFYESASICIVVIIILMIDILIMLIIDNIINNINFKDVQH